VAPKVWLIRLTLPGVVVFAHFSGEMGDLAKSFGHIMH
jgi:hypothetical protein